MYYIRLGNWTDAIGVLLNRFDVSKLKLHNCFKKMCNNILSICNLTVSEP